MLLHPLNLLDTIGLLPSAVIYFTLDSEANEDPPEFTLTCQSRGGPVTEVEWMRNGVRVEKDSNHMTSQIIVDTSANTVYNNTLRVRGRESGTYKCTVIKNRRDSITQDDSHDGLSVMRAVLGKYIVALCQNICVDPLGWFEKGELKSKYIPLPTQLTS